MRFLKYYVMQVDQMVEKYLPKIYTTHASIPHCVQAIMGNTKAYLVNFGPHPPPEKYPCLQLKSESRGTKSSYNHEDEAFGLPSNENYDEEDYDEEDYDEEVKSAWVLMLKMFLTLVIALRWFILSKTPLLARL